MNIAKLFVYRFRMEFLFNRGSDLDNEIIFRQVRSKIDQHSPVMRLEQHNNESVIVENLAGETLLQQVVQHIKSILLIYKTFAIQTKRHLHGSD